jgi:hypothetical protein
MYVTLRRYTRLGTPREAILYAAEQELVPLLKRLDGFRGYCAFWSDEGYAVGMSIFGDQATAEEANAQARRWVEQNKTLFPEVPEVFSGSCRFHALAEEREQHDGGGPLYVMIQKFDDMPTPDQTRPISRDVLMPAITRLPGFRGLYMVRNEQEQGRSAVVMLFENKESAHQCHARLMDLMRQHMPGAKARPLVGGQTGIMAIGG